LKSGGGGHLHEKKENLRSLAEIGRWKTRSRGWPRIGGAGIRFTPDSGSRGRGKAQKNRPGGRGSAKLQARGVTESTCITAPNSYRKGVGREGISSRADKIFQTEGKTQLGIWGKRERARCREEHAACGGERKGLTGKPITPGKRGDRAVPDKGIGKRAGNMCEQVSSTRRGRTIAKTGEEGRYISGKRRTKIGGDLGRNGGRRFSNGSRAHQRTEHMKLTEAGGQDKARRKESRQTDKA